MSCTECVVLAFGHTRKSADTAQLTVCGELVSSARDDFVGIGLMADIPNELVVWGVINVVYGHGEFYRTQTRGQVAGVFRALLNDVLTQLAAITRQVVDLKTFQVGGRIDTI